MGKLTEYLADHGCLDMEKTMHRFCGNEDFYGKCFVQFLNDPGFGQLKELLSTHDIPAAFETAHTLKGVSANLGITPMYELLVQIVEPLRAGSDEQADKFLEELFALRDMYMRETRTAGNKKLDLK